MQAFAYQNKPDQVKESSSGGAFRRILIQIVQDNPDKKFSFYGAIWKNDLTVHHERVSDVFEAIKKFSGSKYVRSDMKGIFELIKKDILQGYFVVFSGTPCQVASVTSFINNNNLDSNHLFTIDIICHGTPKPMVLKDTLQWWEKKEGSKITNLSFRDKRVGWKDYPVSILFVDGKEWVNTYKTQLYIRMFFKHLVLFQGCYSCKFSNMNRISDITLGDFWGIEDVFPDLPPQKGVSLILANTDKGIQIIKSVKMSLQDGELLRKCNDNSFLKYQHNLNHPTRMPEQYDEFWKDYREKGFEYVIRKYDMYSLHSYYQYCVRKVKLGILKILRKEK